VLFRSVYREGRLFVGKTAKLGEHKLISTKDKHSFFNRFRIPLFPIVLKTYEEYGPGNPSIESMNKPSSSIMIGFLNLENASLAFAIAIASSEFD